MELTTVVAIVALVIGFVIGLISGLYSPRENCENHYEDKLARKAIKRLVRVLGGNVYFYNSINDFQICDLYKLRDSPDKLDKLLKYLRLELEHVWEDVKIVKKKK